MSTVALVGGDGAGKTTIARRLMQSGRIPMKYVYMGFSARSSNFALPTSRLVLWLKQRAYGKARGFSGAAPLEEIPANSLEYEEVKRSPLWVAARFLNRLAEAGFRQAISMSYQLRGYVVVYDRHFLFDAAPLPAGARAQQPPPLDRLYHWILGYAFPKPDLVVFLDAPPEVLYARKGEATPEYLDRQREAYLQQGKKVRRFVRVDATQPLETVVDQVTRLILTTLKGKAVHPPAEPDQDDRYLNEGS